MFGQAAMGRSFCANIVDSILYERASLYCFQNAPGRKFSFLPDITEKKNLISSDIRKNKPLIRVG